VGLDHWAKKLFLLYFRYPKKTDKCLNYIKNKKKKKKNKKKKNKMKEQKKKKKNKTKKRKILTLTSPSTKTIRLFFWGFIWKF